MVDQESPKGRIDPQIRLDQHLVDLERRPLSGLILDLLEHLRIHLFIDPLDERLAMLTDGATLERGLARDHDLFLRLGVCAVLTLRLRRLGRVAHIGSLTLNLPEINESSGNHMVHEQSLLGSLLLRFFLRSARACHEAFVFLEERTLK